LSNTNESATVTKIAKKLQSKRGEVGTLVLRLLLFLTDQMQWNGSMSCEFAAKISATRS
jgi:hypothetical protein